MKEFLSGNNNASIIIPNYNGFELLEKNMPYVLKAFNNKNNRISELVVVDDGSTDVSSKFIKKFYPQVRLIQHKINRGFSAAVNTGVRSTKSSLIVLLNNDVVPSSDFLEDAHGLFIDEKVFAVSFHEKGYGWAKGKFEYGFINHGQGSESKKPHITFWANGGSGAFRRDYWMKLGGMDEKLLSPFYWEDVDLSYRAMKRGWSIYWEPKAKVVHEHESTTGKIPLKYRQRIQERNQLIFIWKNITSWNLFRKHMVGLLRRLIKHPGYIRIILMSVLKLRNIYKARKKEIK